MAKEIINKCDCIPALFTVKPIQVPTCTLKQGKFGRKREHLRILFSATECATPHYFQFNYNKCNCLPSCDEKHFTINSVHYGKWRETMRRSHLISGSASFTLFASEQDEIVYQEEPDYPFHSFISDIGGATGVILGMSLVTVISPRATDCIDYYIFLI